MRNHRHAVHEAASFTIGGLAVLLSVQNNWLVLPLLIVWGTWFVFGRHDD